MMMMMMSCKIVCSIRTMTPKHCSMNVKALCYHIEYDDCRVQKHLCWQNGYKIYIYTFVNAKPKARRSVLRKVPEIETQRLANLLRLYD